MGAGANSCDRVRFTFGVPPQTVHQAGVLAFTSGPFDGYPQTWDFREQRKIVQ